MAAIDIDIMAGLSRILGDHLFIEKVPISEETRFTEDLKADSLDMAEITFLIEEAFAITIPTDLADHVVTVGDAAAIIQAQRERAKP